MEAHRVRTVSGRRYTFHVEDPHDDPDRMAAAVATFERLGYPAIECPALETRLRRRERDEWLRRAHGLMSADSPWKRCVLLAGEIRTFESRDHTSPERRSELRRCLFEARRCGPLPATPEQLRNIVLKQNTPPNFAPDIVDCAAGPERG